jgi:curved DNA-binding protein CbpA
LKDYYQILGVEETASLAEIKKSYRKLSLKFHPDKNEGDDYFTRFFYDIQEAYDVLSDPFRRRQYDNNRSRNSGSSTYQEPKPPVIEFFEVDRKEISDDDNEVLITWSCTNALGVSIASMSNLDLRGEKRIKVKRKSEKIDFTEIKLRCFGFQGQVVEKTLVVRFINDVDEEYIHQFADTYKNLKKGTAESRKKTSSLNTIRIFFIVFFAMIGTIFLFNEKDDGSSEIGELQIIPTDKNDEYVFVDGDLYRNTKYKFRIKFPSNWEIKPGDGPNILVKAISDNGNINIGVKHFSGDFNKSYTIKSIYTDANTYRSLMYNDFNDKFPDVEVNRSGEIKIDNRPAYFIDTTLSYEAMDTYVKTRMLTIQLFSGGIVYTISGAALETEFSNLENSLENSISTFVIEDF